MRFVTRMRFVWLAGAAIAIVIVVLVGSTQPRYVNMGDGVALAEGNPDGDLATIPDTPPNNDEQALLDRTNADRARFGVPPVSFDPETLKVARLRAAAQSPGSALSHYNSLGEVAFVGLLADAGVSFTRAGENLARAPSTSPGTVTRLAEALMSSPIHRANILEPSFNRLAAGEANDTDAGV